MRANSKSVAEGCIDPDGRGQTCRSSVSPSIHGAGAALINRPGDVDSQPEWNVPARRSTPVDMWTGSTRKNAARPEGRPAAFRPVGAWLVTRSIREAARATCAQQDQAGQRGGTRAPDPRAMSELGERQSQSLLRSDGGEEEQQSNGDKPASDHLANREYHRSAPPLTVGANVGPRRGVARVNTSSSRVSRSLFRDRNETRWRKNQAIPAS